MAAAPVLFWEVARVAGQDPSDPVVALEAGVALAPRPGSAGSWPSLYKSLCQVVMEHGSRSETAKGPRHSMLMSQIKPLLQATWHSMFDENWTFFNANGSVAKTKKLKHLVSRVIEWRDQLRQSSDMKAPLEQALLRHLALEKAERHNDLLLSCFEPSGTAQPEVPALEQSADTAERRR